MFFRDLGFSSLKLRGLVVYGFGVLRVLGFRVLELGKPKGINSLSQPGLSELDRKSSSSETSNEIHQRCLTNSPITLFAKKTKHGCLQYDLSTYVEGVCVSPCHARKAGNVLCVGRFMGGLSGGFLFH